jgi:hypothetical protein
VHPDAPVSSLDFSPVARTGSHSALGHCFSRRDYSSSGLHRLYCAYAVHLDVPSQRSTSRQSVALALAVCPVIPLCVMTTCLVAATDILRLLRASGCLGTSRGSSSTTSPRAGSSLTTSTTPRVRMLRHIARLVTRLVAPFVVDFFAYAVRPGASARRAARRATRRRLLRLRRVSGCLGTSRGSSSTTSTMSRVRVLVVWLVTPLVVDYFAYVACPGASARHTARCAARRRLLHLCRTSGCLSSSRGSLCRSSSTSSPTLCVRVPRHIARLVMPLFVDFFAYAVRSGASARRAARCRLLRLRRASWCLSTSRGSSRGSSLRLSSTTSTTPRVRVPRHVSRLVTRLVVPLVVDFFAYAVRPGASARRAARRRLLHLCRASGCLGMSRSSSRGSSSTTLCAATSSCGHTGSTSSTPCAATTCLAETLALLRARRVLPQRRLPVASRRPFISTSFPN